MGGGYLTSNNTQLHFTVPLQFWKVQYNIRKDNHDKIFPKTVIVTAEFVLYGPTASIISTFSNQQACYLFICIYIRKTKHVEDSEVFEPRELNCLCNARRDSRRPLSSFTVLSMRLALRELRTPSTCKRSVTVTYKSAIATFFEILRRNRITTI